MIYPVRKPGFSGGDLSRSSFERLVRFFRAYPVLILLFKHVRLDEVSNGVNKMKKNMVRALFLVLAVAFVIRLVHILSIQSSPLAHRLFIDSEIYDHWALEITQKGVVGSQPFYQDPLYPYALAIVYALFGHNLFVIRLLQVIGGTLVCYLIYRTAHLLFNNEKVGLVAALLSGLYLPFVFYDGEVEKTALGVILAAFFAWSFVSAYKNKLSWVIPGISLGLATLVRSNFLVLGIGLLLLSISTTKFKPFLFFLIGLVAMVGPVVIRNSILARELTFTTTQAGQNFYIGNSPFNRTGDYAPPTWIRRHPRFEEEDFRSYAQNKLGRNLRYSEVSNFYFHQAFSFIVRNVGTSLKVTLKKILLYLNNYEVPDNQDISFVAIYSPLLKLPLLQFGLIFALALVGLVSMRRRPIDYLLWAAFILFGMTVIVFFVFSRYRIPSIPFIMPYAALGLMHLVEIVRRKHWSKLTLSLLIFVPAFAFTLIPMKSTQDLRSTKAQCLANLATKFYQEDSVDKAIALYNQALTVTPYHTNSLHDLGVIYFFKRDFVKAEDYFNRCLKLEPSHYAANFFLAKVYEESGRLPEALQFYEKAKNVQPGNLEIQFCIGTNLQKLGRYQDAIRVYEEMLKLAPSNPLIYHNLSVAYFNLKDYYQAKVYLDKARSLGLTPNPSYEKALNQKL